MQREETLLKNKKFFNMPTRIFATNPWTAQIGQLIVTYPINMQFTIVDTRLVLWSFLCRGSMEHLRVGGGHKVPLQNKQTHTL